MGPDCACWVSTKNSKPGMVWNQMVTNLGFLRQIQLGGLLPTGIFSHSSCFFNFYITEVAWSWCRSIDSVLVWEWFGCHLRNIMDSFEISNSHLLAYGQSECWKTCLDNVPFNTSKSSRFAVIWTSPEHHNDVFQWHLQLGPIPVNEGMIWSPEHHDTHWHYNQ